MVAGTWQVVFRHVVGLQIKFTDQDNYNLTFWEIWNPKDEKPNESIDCKNQYLNIPPLPLLESSDWSNDLPWRAVDELTSSNDWLISWQTFYISDFPWHLETSNLGNLLCIGGWLNLPVKWHATKVRLLGLLGKAKSRHLHGKASTYRFFKPLCVVSHSLGSAKIVK